MAEDSDKSEKTEPPSPFKLSEAKKKGQVFKSQEMNSLVALSLVFLLLTVAGGSLMRNVFHLCESVFKQSATLNFTVNELGDFFGNIIVQMGYILSPIVAVMFIGGVLATVLQTGLVFSTFPLKPDIKRMNPVTGLKRIFSMKTIFEFFKAMIKIAAFAIVIFVTLDTFLPEILSLSQRTTAALIPFFVDHSSQLLFRLLCIVFLIALIDILFVYWEYMRNMRMTKKELKDEYKRRDGDPKIKQKRKELQRELLKKAQSMRSVPSADMVISNPTHYAIAIKYDQEKMVAPEILAKGKDILAQKIMEQAKTHGIPVFESPALARQLYRDCEIGQGIPAECYIAVARLLRKVYLQRQTASSHLVQGTAV